MNGPDRLIQGMTAGGDFRILAAQTTNSVIEARNRLDLSPTAATALGRALTGAVLLARLLDKHYRNQRVTLRFEGGGPLGTVVAEGSVSGGMRGTVEEPQYDDPTVNVGAAVGPSGMLTVVRATPPDGRPYTSQLSLENGEIASDLSRYLMNSEQIHSAVLLGVLTAPSGIVSAGGLIVQAFPYATEASVQKMEDAIRNAVPLSRLLGKMGIEDALREIFDGIGYRQIDKSYDVPLAYKCNCTRDRAFAPFQLFDRSEINEMIEEGGSQVSCQFCGQRYFFTPEELKRLPRLVAEA